VKAAVAAWVASAKAVFRAMLSVGSVTLRPRRRRKVTRA
jgi:hypothetical protein